MAGEYYADQQKQKNNPVNSESYSKTPHIRATLNRFEKSKNFAQQPQEFDVISQFCWQAMRYQAALKYLQSQPRSADGDKCLQFHCDHLMNVYQPLVDFLRQNKTIALKTQDKNALEQLTEYLNSTYQALGDGVFSKILWNEITATPATENLAPLETILQQAKTKKPLHPAIRSVIGGVIGLIVFGIIGAIVGAVLSAPAGGIGIFAGTLIGMFKGYTFGSAFTIGASAGGLIGGALLGGVSGIRPKEDQPSKLNLNTLFASTMRQTVTNLRNTLSFKPQ